MLFICYLKQDRLKETLKFLDIELVCLFFKTYLTSNQIYPKNKLSFVFSNITKFKAPDCFFLAIICVFGFYVSIILSFDPNPPLSCRFQLNNVNLWR